MVRFLLFQVVLLESLIVISTGLLIKYVPHKDPVTGKEMNQWLKYIDPTLTLVMVIIIIVRAVPVIFSLSDMLIENVPKGIDTDVLMNEIIDAVPEIKQIHSFHIWRSVFKSFPLIDQTLFFLFHFSEQVQTKSMRHFTLLSMKT